MHEAPKKQHTENSEKKINRRTFLAGLGASAAIAPFVKPSITRGMEAYRYENNEPEPLAKDIESPEILPNSEAFEAEKLGWKKWWQLNYNEVLFVDDKGTPVGDLVEFQDFIVKRQREGADGKPEEFDYRLAPGATDETGMLSGNIADEWLRYVKAKHARENPEYSGELHQRNITEEFEKAVLRKDKEPELRESILNAVAGGNGIESMVDIVRYYGMNPDKPVQGDPEHRTRSEYLRDQIQLHNKIPKLIQNEIRGCIVGLAAQESRFNGGLPKNKSTAEGILQLVDDVRKENGFNPDQKLTFAQEVEVCGKHFSNIYTRLQYWMKKEIVEDAEGEKIRKERPETFTTLRGLFPQGAEGEEQWQKYFLTPCMINAYNTGSWTIGACLHEFVAAHTVEELQALVGENPGYDFFMAFTHFAKGCDVNEYTQQYGDDAQSYFVSIMAASEALSVESEAGEDLVAQNIVMSMQ